MYFDYTFDAWNDLQERFSQKNASRVYQIKKAISNLNQEGKSVTSYYTQLKGLWDELSSLNPLLTCNCGGLKAMVEREQEDKLLQFLVGMNESFAAIRGHILAISPLPNINMLAPPSTSSAPETGRSSPSAP